MIGTFKLTRPPLAPAAAAAGSARDFATSRNPRNAGKAWMFRAPVSLCGVHLRMLDGPSRCPFENARWTPGHSWTREVRQAPKVEGISLQHVLQASEILRIVILSAIYLTDKCRTQGTPLGICNGMTKALGAEFNRQVVARAAYSISRIDRDQFRRLSG